MRFSDIIDTIVDSYFLFKGGFQVDSEEVLASRQLGIPLGMALPPELEALFKNINLLDENYRILGNVLAKAAQSRSTIAATFKILVILLGALVATRETANQLLGASSIAST